MAYAGDLFPNFSLNDSDGNTVTNSVLNGKTTVIYFYPKDSTPGCTQESCDFRDLSTASKSVQIIGISPDDAKSHQKFIDKFQLNFTLLCDTENALAEELGIWVEKSMFGKKYMGIERTTYLIDGKGVIQKIWNNVSVGNHAKEVMDAAKEVEASSGV